MISTIAQYFLVTFCVLFLAGSFVRAGEHGSDVKSKTRELSSVVKEEAKNETALTVPNEEGEKLIDTHKELQSKLMQFKTGTASEEVDE